jgi:pimeloyl-ACP methyl ester carboxylesterase
MKVYFISGLAADKRVFKNILVPSHCEMVHLDWIPPVNKETLTAYSLRLAKKIDTEEPFSLVGLSMGGMIAAEIARHYRPAQVILISSVPSSEQLPVYFKWAAMVKLHKLVPVSLGKSASIMKRLFTAETKEDKEILKQVIRESDEEFIRWSVNAILNWKTIELPSSYIHIHGTRDEVLPLRFVQPTHTIPKGGHLMIMNRAEEINRILHEVL